MLHDVLPPTVCSADAAADSMHSMACNPASHRGSFWHCYRFQALSSAILFPYHRVGNHIPICGHRSKCHSNLTALTCAPNESGKEPFNGHLVPIALCHTVTVAHFGTPRDGFQVALVTHGQLRLIIQKRRRSTALANEAFL